MGGKSADWGELEELYVPGNAFGDIFGWVFAKGGTDRMVLVTL